MEEEPIFDRAHRVIIAKREETFKRVFRVGTEKSAYHKTRLILATALLRVAQEVGVASEVPHYISRLEAQHIQDEGITLLTTIFVTIVRFNDNFDETERMLNRSLRIEMQKPSNRRSQ